MQIGIIGSGNMGRAIGVRLAQLGHHVTFGARRREQAEAAAATAGHGAQAADTDTAARSGDVLVWTVRDPDPAAVFADPGVVDGKVLLELNNRNYADDVKTGAWFGEAIAEQLQKAAPTAHVIKALNTVAMETFDTAPDALRAAGAQSFVAGDDAAAKAMVGTLLADLGFTPVDLGSGPVAYRAAEALGDVIRLLMIDGGLGPRAHLALGTLPTPDLSTIGARAPSNYR